MELIERFDRAAILRDEYPEFVYFCEDAMKWLGFSMTWMQGDIAEWMQYSPDRAMTQAQRGEAKSTIACIYGTWGIVQDPKTRVLLFSGSGDKAAENGVLIHRLIHHWEPLQYLIPDKSAGDLTGTQEFDVHYSLKGVDKSASVRAMGLTSSIQGYRADILIPDDIETTKNGLTATQRATLTTLSKEFTSICTHGRIHYLGTPQTKDSIYKDLPRRGFDVRVWPGRFPTPEQEAQYGEHLAPSVRERMHILGDKCRTGRGLDGTRGWTTDPERYTEEDQQIKELDQGPETYELQFMLNTALADAARQQLKPRDLIVGDFAHDTVPETLVWGPHPSRAVKVPEGYSLRDPELFYAASHSTAYTGLRNITMTVDPASEGGDELAFAVGGIVGPYMHCTGWGGFPGGFKDDNLELLVQEVKRLGVKRVVVEKNMGAGAVTRLIQNYFNGLDPETGKPRITGVSVEEANSSGQKERRIIDTLRPILQRHRLIMHKAAIEQDHELAQQYPRDRRDQYCGMYQLQNITTDRGSLSKDDRVDVLEQLARQLVDFLVIDEDREERERNKAALQSFLNDPMGTKQFTQRKAPRRSGRAVKRRFG